MMKSFSKSSIALLLIMSSVHAEVDQKPGGILSRIKTFFGATQDAPVDRGEGTSRTLQEPSTQPEARVMPNPAEQISLKSSLDGNWNGEHMAAKFKDFKESAAAEPITLEVQNASVTTQSEAEKQPDTFPNPEDNLLKIPQPTDVQEHELFLDQDSTPFVMDGEVYSLPIDPHLMPDSDHLDETMEMDLFNEQEYPSWPPQRKQDQPYMDKEEHQAMSNNPELDMPTHTMSIPSQNAPAGQPHWSDNE